MLFRYVLTMLILTFSCLSSANQDLVIGSKRFSENYLLAEIFSQLLEDKGYTVVRKFGLGGTLPAFLALENQEIDIYPEYSGTIAQVILKSDISDYTFINALLEKRGLKLLKPLGFDNSYCLVVRKDVSEKMGLVNISDLKNHPDFKGAISFEFQKRKDGWPGLKNVYGLTNQLINLDTPLNYQALAAGEVDFSEAYTTEPMVDQLDLVILKDNKNFFPKYLAAPLVHDKVSAEVVEHLNLLYKKIGEEKVRELAGMVNKSLSIPVVAQTFLLSENLIDPKTVRIDSQRTIQWSMIWKETKTHLLLTGLAILLATLVALPLGSYVAGRKKLSRYILGFTGILQTIPSIALLTFMIPLFGIGFAPAIMGLFIYSLLPILRNTHTAMEGIDPRLITSAKGIGLYPSEIFFSVKLPLAFPTILAGIRTATILNIGTATLAAFIGAGGLGAPIVTGLALNDTNMVLQGAIPAALLAILVDFCFSIIDRIFTRNI